MNIIIVIIAIVLSVLLVLLTIQSISTAHYKKAKRQLNRRYKHPHASTNKDKYKN